VAFRLLSSRQNEDGEDVFAQKEAEYRRKTNVLRTTGRLIAVVTLLLDIAKGFFAVLAGGEALARFALCMSAAALAVMAGHAYPIFLNFRGGKAVASFIGAFLYLTPIRLQPLYFSFVNCGGCEQAYFTRLDKWLPDAFRSRSG